MVRLNNSDIMFKMTRALENGFPVLIENMEESIDATLMPVVARRTQNKGSKKFIKLGDDEIELHKDFHLYMHTKLSNPHYPPEIQAECTLVNFTVTPSGLEDQVRGGVPNAIPHPTSPPYRGLLRPVSVSHSCMRGFR